MLKLKPLALAAISALLALPALADPQPAPSPEPHISLETVVVDYSLRLTLKGVPEGCSLVRVALLRRDELRPGYGAFMRPVRIDKSLGRVVSLELGPEFQPHRYEAGDLRLGCYDAEAKWVRELANRVPLSFDTTVLNLDIAGNFADAPKP